MRARDPQQELRELFSGLVEQAFFTDMGLCAPALTDYVSGMLADFVHVDHIYRVQAVDGDVIREAARLQTQADLGSTGNAVARDRAVNRYIGDFTLFWVGLYPETLRARRQGGVDRVHEYLLQGKRGYGVASALSRLGDLPPADLLRELSEQFECCVQGLHLVRQSWAQLTRQPRHN